MIRNNTIAVRIKLFAVFVMLLFAAVTVRFHHIQVNRHEELFDKARRQYTAVVRTQGKRGEIYDFNGNLLVGNIPCTTIVADPYEAGNEEKCEQTAKIIGKALDLPWQNIRNELLEKTRTRTLADGSTVSVPRRYAFIAKEVPLPVSESLRAELRAAKARGIYFQEETKRYYPKNELLANILGFTNIDRDRIIAVLGIEKFFNTVISPIQAEGVYERALDGAPLGLRNTPRGKDGINIYLTVKEPIQAIVEEELDQLMQKWRPRAAYVVMVEPQTGNVLAIAQRPTFNPNDRSTMNAEAWRSRITEDIFEPGSTMKPIAIAGAIDAGIISPDTVFDCEKGLWSYGGKTLRDTSPHELLSVAGIVQKSSNIGTAKIALMMGEKRLYDTLYAFGFRQPTGLPMKPETLGILRPVRQWDTLSITRFPIGQGMACSPVQLVRAYCALANGGKLVELRLVDRIKHPENDMTIKYPFQTPHNIYRNPATHRKMLDMMKLVTMPGGTGTRAAVPGYHVAGKSGTSQKFIGGAYRSQYFASFIGFVPADNPRFVLLVTADEPQGAHYGGTVCGPTFRNISARTLRYLNVPPDYQVEEKKTTPVRRPAARRN